MKNITLFLCIFILINCRLSSQVTLYDINTIQKIEINFTQSNWDFMLDTAKLGDDGYTMASWIKINGTQFDSVGVKYKGNSSFDSTYKKNPWNIALDQYKSQNYQGLKKLKLANGFSDPSMIRDVLGYQIAGNYLEAPRANFAEVYVNGELIGLYANTEPVNKPFCATHFGNSSNTFISCSPAVVPTPQIKSNLKFLESDSTKYFDAYELESKYGWKDLVELCDSVTNNSASIPSMVDLDRFIWMIAFDNVIINLDSYIGVFSQNYYLYRDNTKQYNPIIWDLNMSFGGFPHVGSSNTSMGSLSVSQLANLPLVLHEKDSYWPLINYIFANSFYKKLYYAHLKTIYEEMVKNDKYLEIALNLRTIIDNSVKKDNNKFFTYEQFQNALSTDINVGTYDVPGIQKIMEARKVYFSTQSILKVPAPTISQTNIENAIKDANAKVTAKFENSNLTSSYLYYRFDKTKKFSRVQMYDDGNHNDGAANDNIYGVDILFAAASMEYYFLGENDYAITVYPARATKEFLTKDAQSSVNDYMFDGSLSVYPNPANDKITVNFNNSNSAIQILNSYGDKVFQSVINNSMDIQTSDFPNGVYFIIIDNKINKFVINH